MLFLSYLVSAKEQCSGPIAEALGTSAKLLCIHVLLFPVISCIFTKLLSLEFLTCVQIFAHSLNRRILASQVVLAVKNLPANAGDPGDPGSIPGLGRSPGVGNGNLLQYSFLQNSTDRGAWLTTLHGVTESDTTS